MKNINIKKKLTSSWFRDLRDQLCLMLEKKEHEHGQHEYVFQKKKWLRDPSNKKDLGGGEISILRGKIFEKAGVNISTVNGQFSKEFRSQIPGTTNNPSFWASGISLVIHPKSPRMPIVHMNTRFIVTEKSWFGGGADITPINKISSESKILADLFHLNFREICENYKKGSYTEFKEWCDKYFYLPHRKEIRGLGGIFYDYIDSSNWDKDFEFTKNVGKVFLETYDKIIDKTVNHTWSKKDVEEQKLRRSRYVEFNLLYDRGTKFGLMTNGNPEAILMSLPPSLGW